MSVYAQEYGYFFNSSSSDRTYNAESFEKWLKPFFVSGVFTGGLEVVAQDTPDMTVNITAGYANLDGKLGFFPNDSTVSIAVASGVYDRIDTIVLRRDNVNRTVSIEVVTGVASVDPQPTPPTRDVDTYELVLAQILVGTGVTEIGQGDITDTRLDPDLCGYVCAAVQTPDFMDLYDQFTAQFQTWFDHMKDQLDDDAAGHLQLEIDDIVAAMGVVPAGETLQGEIEQADEDMGIVVNGNKTTHAGGAAMGQYIILRNSTITGCANGVYTAAKAIPYNTVIDSTYLTHCPDGGFNALNASITSVEHYALYEDTIGYESIDLYKIGKIVSLRTINTSSSIFPIKIPDRFLPALPKRTGYNQYIRFYGWGTDGGGSNGRLIHCRINIDDGKLYVDNTVSNGANSFSAMWTTE